MTAAEAPVDHKDPEVLLVLVAGIADQARMLFARAQHRHSSAAVDCLSYLVPTLHYLAFPSISKPQHRKLLLSQ